ncbi:hypothetical protein ACTXT7_012829 [Hymenolepis weldensis]
MSLTGRTLMVIEPVIFDFTYGHVNHRTKGAIHLSSSSTIILVQLMMPPYDGCMFENCALGSYHPTNKNKQSKNELGHSTNGPSCPTHGYEICQRLYRASFRTLLTTRVILLQYWRLPLPTPSSHPFPSVQYAGCFT